MVQKLIFIPTEYIRGIGYKSLPPWSVVISRVFSGSGPNHWVNVYRFFMLSESRRLEKFDNTEAFNLLKSYEMAISLMRKKFLLI